MKSDLFPIKPSIMDDPEQIGTCQVSLTVLEPVLVPLREIKYSTHTCTQKPHNEGLLGLWTLILDNTYSQCVNNAFKLTLKELRLLAWNNFMISQLLVMGSRNCCHMITILLPFSFTVSIRMKCFHIWRQLLWLWKSRRTDQVLVFTYFQFKRF